MRKKGSTSIKDKPLRKSHKQSATGHSTDNAKTVDDLFHALQRQQEVLEEILLWDDFIKAYKKGKK